MVSYVPHDNVKHQMLYQYERKKGSCQFYFETSEDSEYLMITGTLNTKPKHGASSCKQRARPHKRHLEPLNFIPRPLRSRLQAHCSAYRDELNDLYAKFY